jgi:hypothetical protein
MRTSRQTERQQQRRQGKPFLHIVSLSSYLMSRQYEGATVVGINTCADKVLWRRRHESSTAKAQSGMLPDRLEKRQERCQSGRFAGASEEAVGGEMVRSGVGAFASEGGQKWPGVLTPGEVAYSDAHPIEMP